jgi:hypothetical protein
MEIMNKQELIEKAVINLDGNLPDGTSALLTTGPNWNGSKNVTGKVLPAIAVDGFFGYEWPDKPQSQSFPVISDEAWVVLCTSEEFNATADRMRRNKPDWKDAPEWAQWLAQNNVGVWWWYPSGDVPMIYGGCFANNSMKDRAVMATQGKVIGDWRNTLEQRPVEASSHTIAHFLDKCAAASNVNDWWDYENDKPAYDGALPPVGTVVLYDDAKGWLETKILSHHPDGSCAWHEAEGCFSDGRSWSTDAGGLFKPLDHDRNKKPCAEFGLRMANAKNEIDAAAKLCGKNKILADAVFAIGEQIKSVKKGAE